MREAQLKAVMRIIGLEKEPKYSSSHEMYQFDAEASRLSTLLLEERKVLALEKIASILAEGPDVYVKKLPGAYDP